MQPESGCNHEGQAGRRFNWIGRASVPHETLLEDSEADQARTESDHRNSQQKEKTGLISLPGRSLPQGIRDRLGEVTEDVNEEKQ